MRIASRYATGADAGAVVAKQEALRDQLGAMYEQQHELFGGRRTNSVDVQQRNACMQAAFRDALGEPEA